MVSTNSANSHAIVIGGSIAGLWAGRILTDHFQRVTIIDRDYYPEKPEFRNGVPQAHHTHILLARGLQMMEQLFPNLTAEFNAAGAETFDIGEKMYFLGRTGWANSFHTGVESLAASRALMESIIRQRLAKLPRVSFIQGAEAAGLITDESKARVTGVQLHYRRGADGKGDQTLTADLVVDASGRGSNAPEWLEKLGYSRPEETIIDSFLGYATRWYQPPAGYTKPWKLIFISAAAPELPRGGGILEVEGGKWIATLTGAARDYPPTDETRFMEFSKTLLSRAVYDALKDAEPISPIYGYQRTANQFRHYERLRRFPDGFVLIGDSACCFNPIYGQGMTAAGMGALALDETLRQDQGAGMSLRFQKKLAKVVQTPWVMATGEDFRYPTTEGGSRTLMTRLSHWYTDNLVQAIPGNPDLGQQFVEVSQLLKPPSLLMRPALVAKVMAFAVRRRNVEYPKQYDAPASFKQANETQPV